MTPTVTTRDSEVGTVMSATVNHGPATALTCTITDRHGRRNGKNVKEIPI